MSEESKPESPTPAEGAAIERLVEHYHQVAAGVAAAQIVDAHRMHLVWCFTKGFLAAVVGVPLALALLALLLIWSA